MVGHASATRLPIDLPKEWIDRSYEWARVSVSGYAAGRKEQSRKYARPGIDKSIEHQAMGRMGECAFCLWAHLDPDAALDWSAKCDRGYDVLIDGVRFDVKATNTARLIWPVTKIAFLATAPIDVLVLVEARQRPLMFISGWITKTAFIARYTAVLPDSEISMDLGTPFMEQSELHCLTETRLYASLYGDAIQALMDAKKKAVAAYWLKPGDETWRAAAEATKAANSGKWP